MRAWEQVIIVPILAGISGRGVQPLTWFSALAALLGVSMLEGGGSPPCLGDVWSFLSALAFGVQVRPFQGCSGLGALAWGARGRTGTLRPAVASWLGCAQQLLRRTGGTSAWRSA